MQKERLLMISTDRKIFEKDSAVRLRQITYAKNWQEVHIIIFAKKGQMPNEDVLSPNCFVYSSRSRWKFFYPFDAIRLGRFLIKRRMITQITCQDASLTAMAGLGLKKEFNLPLEIQVHEDLGSSYYSHNLTNKIRKVLAYKYLPQADKVRVVSEKIKNHLIGNLGLDHQKVFVKPIEVDMGWLKKAPITIDLHKKYSQFDKIILMASRLEKEKNIELAIRAFTEVSPRYAVSGGRFAEGSTEVTPRYAANVGLVIVGSGSLLPKIQSLISALGLKDKVILEEWVDQATLASYYKTSDVFLNTSLFEGYGMTLVEAQAAGARVVSTDVGIAREIGATIVSFDVKDIARKLSDVLFKK